jgi:hypothetical protein
MLLLFYSLGKDNIITISFEYAILYISPIDRVGHGNSKSFSRNQQLLCNQAHEDVIDTLQQNNALKSIGLKKHWAITQ